MTPATPAILMVRAYRLLCSPLMPRVCRFYPSCSKYAETALITHGLWRGLLLTIGRLARCHPFCAGGYDPVPGTDKVAEESRRRP